MKTFPQRNGRVYRRKITHNIILSLIAFIFTVNAAAAQDGNAGINQATSEVKGYFSASTSLMYAIGAIVGLVGAIKVYKKWNDGDHDTGKVASAWMGSLIFLVVVATILKSFFGV